MRPGDAEVGDCLEHERTGGIENGFVVSLGITGHVAFAGRQTTDSIGQILRLRLSKHQPGVSRCGEITNLARDVSQRRGLVGRSLASPHVVVGAPDGLARAPSLPSPLGMRGRGSRIHFAHY